MEFTKQQRERYARQMIINEIGPQGQEKLLHSKVLVIGAGGLGSPAALYLAAAGVGTIGTADADEVDLSNLQRQILHGQADLGRSKVQSAKETLNGINPDILVNIYPMRVNASNILDLVKDYDLVIDAADNFETKFLINDACVFLKKPFVHAGVTRFGGQMMTYVPRKGPCYRCIFKEPPQEGVVPSGRDNGIIGAVCGVIGSLQAVEAVKYLLGEGDLLTGHLLTFDGLAMNFRRIRLPQRVKDCAACGDQKTGHFPRPFIADIL